MKFEFLHPADQIIMIMERIYGYGMTTTSGGNISIIDDNGDLWITPAGVDKGSLTRKDIVCIKQSGVIEGIHKPSSELPFHQTIYQKRKDIKAVIHAHSPALVSFSIVRKAPNTSIIPDAGIICGEVGIAEYDVPGSVALGEKIAKVFRMRHNSVMLENHGVVVGHQDLFKAFMAFETLDFCARIEIYARRIGEPVYLSEEKIELSIKEQKTITEHFVPSTHTSEEKEARREMSELIHRAYRQRLFMSTQGTFSQRLNDNSFLITPYKMDRNYISAEDLVLMNRGRAEEGKTPSRAARLHQYIYENQPHVNSIIIAHPPYIMAFAVTKETFNSRTIPESYILLRNVPKINFSDIFINPEGTAKIFREDTPVAIVENDCVIVTGNSLLNAFDRLEVAEYSARGVIDSKRLGEMITISNEQVSDINRAFNLK